jgi:hypothetical protein
VGQPALDKCDQLRVNRAGEAQDVERILAAEVVLRDTVTGVG